MGSFGGGGAQAHAIFLHRNVNTIIIMIMVEMEARGSAGAVRIIWGPGRSFPSTNTEDV